MVGHSTPDLFAPSMVLQARMGLTMTGNIASGNSGGLGSLDVSPDVSL